MSFLALWLGVMFPLVFSPGPANIVFATSGAKVGIRRSLPLLCGIDLVFILKSVLVGYGFGAVLHDHPMAFQLLQLLGALYLFYLAIGFLRSGKNTEEQQQKFMGFRDGLMVQLLNSKGWVMVVLMFSLFTEPAEQQFGSTAIPILIVLLALLNVSMHLLWIGAGKLLERLSRQSVIMLWQNQLYALSLTLVSVWLLADNPIWQT
ncbi:LysE family translocator [Bowmanella denitrificans]|uniref:LysE family translocator n=1 Tax=Bowmanella denitrificans TaxID=366582 RepID=UPI000C9C6236|nr:LysE family translocator [Bowmanella denitrificans]